MTTYGDLFGSQVDVTVEGWFWLNENPVTAYYAMGFLTNSSCDYLSLGVDEEGDADVRRLPGNFVCDGADTVRLSDWNHMAVTFSFLEGSTVRVFLNGELHCTSDGDGATIREAIGFDPGHYAASLDESVFMGGESYSGACAGEITGPVPTPDVSIDGMMAGVRYSSVQRYSGSFSPTYPLTTDSDTFMNLAMDEGKGTYLNDSSGHGFEGLLWNGTWVDTCPGAE